jgi:hypothetical protein
MSNDFGLKYLVSCLVIIFLTCLILGVLTSCGSDEGNGAGNGTSEVAITEEKSTPEGAEKGHHIALATSADLPVCDTNNKDQLAYIIEEDVFYVCSTEWAVIDIQGKDGKDGADGKDGVTQIKEIPAPNRLNYWNDAQTGLEWFLGGQGLYAAALSSCQSGYRLPTVAESETAVYHGIRVIAQSISSPNLNFWTSEIAPNNVEAAYMGVNGSGLPMRYWGLKASTIAGIFCVKAAN